MPTVAEILAKKRAERSEYVKLGDFVGQTLEFVAIEEVPSKYPEPQLQVTVEKADGTVVDNLRTSSRAVVETLQELDSEDLLPTKLKVISFQGAGGTGYDLEEVE